MPKSKNFQYFRPNLNQTYKLTWAHNEELKIVEIFESKPTHLTRKEKSTSRLVISEQCVINRGRGPHWNAHGNPRSAHMSRAESREVKAAERVRSGEGEFPGRDWRKKNGRGHGRDWMGMRTAQDKGLMVSEKMEQHAKTQGIKYISCSV